MQRKNRYPPESIPKGRAEERRDRRPPEDRGSIDITLPGDPMPAGRIHPLSQTVMRVKDALIGMGYEFVDGPSWKSTSTTSRLSTTRKTIPPSTR